MISIRARRLFDGVSMRGAAVVGIAGGRIAEIGATGPDDANSPVSDWVDVDLLTPGFIDLQVNGGDGVMLNDMPNAEGVRRIGDAHARHGTTTILPTLISGARSTIAALPPGAHIEGPFISRARRGIHPEASLLDLGDGDEALLSRAALVTLAPECVPLEAIERLSRDVAVFAGHTEADPQTIRGAVDRGLRGVTHLFNAMPHFASRAPGPVGAALAMGELYAGIIVDLHHVAATSVVAALAAKGADRLFLVSDAMATAASTASEFRIGGERITLRDGRLTNSAGTLAGAHLTMIEAIRNVVAACGIGLADALRMATATPADCMAWTDRGRIRIGARADLVALTDTLEVARVWRGGEPLSVSAGKGLPQA